MGRAMLSKTLVQFSVDGWGCVPSLLFICKPNYGGKGEVKAVYCHLVYAEYIMRNAGLDEAQAGIKIARRNSNNFRYADDITLMAESEELKSLLMKVRLMLKLKLQYIGHLMQRADSLEKSLMLGKIEGRRRGQQRMRWLDGITDSMHEFE